MDFFQRLKERFCRPRFLQALLPWVNCLMYTLYFIKYSHILQK